VARHVADAAVVFQVVLGTGAPAASTRTATELVPLDEQALKGARLGSIHESYEQPGLDRRVLELFNGAVGELGNLGATIVERTTLGGSDQPGNGLAIEGDSGERLRLRLLELMDQLELDALVYPSFSVPPAGLPFAIVPMGYTRDRALRPGLQFVGRSADDLALIRLAYSYEQATDHRRPPR